MEIMKTPRWVDLSITHHCNLRMQILFLFYSTGDVHQDLPKGEWIKFFEELNTCAVMEVASLEENLS